MKVVSWNAHSLDESKMLLLFEVMKKLNVSSCFVSETWKMNESIRYDCTFNGMRGYGLNHESGRRGLCCFTAPQCDMKFLSSYTYSTEWFDVLVSVKKRYLVYAML